MRRFLSLTPFAFAAQASALGQGLQPLQARDDVGTLTACLDNAKVPYVDDKSDGWADDIKPQNLRLPYTPHAIVYPTTTEEIQNAVRCGAEHELKVAPKSGGHSYASYGLGGEDGHLVIQLDHMYGVDLKDDNTAVIKAGTRLGYASLELYDQGKRDIPHGTCPSVGLGGHVVHGGFGFSSHTHGLTLDAMIGANVVLANGTVVHASEKENPDLFWALRGAGSSFGIIVDFEFETFSVPEQTTWIDVATNLINGTKDEAVNGLVQWQKLLLTEGVAPELNMRFNVIKEVLEVVYHGNKEDARKALQPLEGPLKLDWDADRTTITQGKWLDSLRNRSGGDPLNITDSYDGHSDAYTSNLITGDLPQSAIEAFIGYLYDTARASDASPWWMLIDVHGDVNSAVTKVPTDATSYVHRDKLWIFQFSGTIKDGVNVAESMDFVKGFMNSIKDNMGEYVWGRYANYVDSELNRDDAQNQYWGKHLDRLQAIKADVDPDELFYNPQSVKPAN